MRMERIGRLVAASILAFGVSAKLIWPASVEPLAPSWLTIPVESLLAAWLLSGRFPGASATLTFLFAVVGVLARLTLLPDGSACGCLGDLHLSKSLAVILMVVLLLSAAMAFPSRRC